MTIILDATQICQKSYKRLHGGNLSKNCNGLCDSTLYLAFDTGVGTTRTLMEVDRSRKSRLLVAI